MSFCWWRTLVSISLEALQRDGYGSVKLIKGGQKALCSSEIVAGRLTCCWIPAGGADGITVGLEPSALHVAPEKEACK
jgi:hypothetical protein